MSQLHHRSDFCCRRFCRRLAGAPGEYGLSRVMPSMAVPLPDDPETLKSDARRRAPARRAGWRRSSRRCSAIASVRRAETLPEDQFAARAGGCGAGRRVGREPRRKHKARRHAARPRPSGEQTVVRCRPICPRIETVCGPRRQELPSPPAGVGGQSTSAAVMTASAIVPAIPGECPQF